jgi:hypothetical protein
VQQNLAPHLSVTGTGDRSVARTWNRPQDPLGGTISGYGLSYRPVGSGSWSRVDLPGDTTLSHEITGLTNGTTYEFEVVGVASGTDGPPSNVVTDTPMGPITAPVVTPVAGEESVQLYWTEADCGGRPGAPSYRVVYRAAGANPWVPGPSNVSARTVTISGLTGEVTFEFGVAAVCGSGESGPIGTAEATPSTAPPDPSGNGIRFTG